MDKDQDCSVEKLDEFLNATKIDFGKEPSLPVKQALEILQAYDKKQNK
jgi:hypothetical protein